MSLYPLPELRDVPEDIRQKILAVQEKAGFVPQVFLMLARRPEQWRAFFAYHDALMLEPKSRLSKAEREMIVVATSAHNHCLYCVVAHGALLRVYAKAPTLADQIAINHRKADISERQMAMLDFALKVSHSSHEINESDFALLARHGFDAEDAWDIAAISAFFAMSNRLANALGIVPNPEFYAMGRLPRSSDA